MHSLLRQFADLQDVDACSEQVFASHMTSEDDRNYLSRV